MIFYKAFCKFSQLCLAVSGDLNGKEPVKICQRDMPDYIKQAFIENKAQCAVLVIAAIVAEKLP